MMHTPAPPFAHTSGPKSGVKLAIIGEAWGEQEERLGLPFVGATGQELTRLLSEAGIARKDCFLSNVFAFRPLSNRIETLCAKKAEVGPGYLYPPYKQGLYIKPEYLGEFERLRVELEEVQPNLILALGNVACIALLRSSKIGSIRGYIAESTLCPGLKVLPTYHPAALFRQWKWRPIVSADLLKAKREGEFPQIVRPEREILVDPTLDEIKSYLEIARKAARMSVDIETMCGQISCIGFACSASYGISIPFVSKTAPDHNYWQYHWQELRAWKYVRELLEMPCEKIFQNGLFDLQYILRMGFRPKACRQDTMLLHHSLFPELQKSLGFMGSIYSNEAPWKLMRKRADEELKKDE